ncbi:regulatory protein RecX [Diaminobutyricibacter tongyongensis]|nr:regulatory protein RecX [Diaminobutyricibacter tongyongensis]
MVRFPPSSDSEDSEHVAPVVFLQRRPARERVAFTRFDDPDGDASFGGTLDENGEFVPKEEPGAARRARVTTISGSDLSDAELEDEHAQKDAEQKARDRAAKLSLDQLARRGMSRWELEQVLKKREIDDETIRIQLNRLEDVGLLDDHALATYLVSTLQERKGLGSAGIKQELKRKHIPEYDIESALAELHDEEEEARAIELAMKRIRQLSTYDDDVVRRRVHAFLARKGYDGHTINSAISVAMAKHKGFGVRFE